MNHSSDSWGKYGFSYDRRPYRKGKRKVKKYAKAAPPQNEQRNANRHHFGGKRAPRKSNRKSQMGNNSRKRR